MLRKYVTLLFVALQVQSATAQDPTLVRNVFQSDHDDVHPTLSPDLRWLVFVRQVSNQQTELVIRPLSGGQERVLAAGKASHFAPGFNPQGDRLLAISSMARRDEADGHLYLVSAPFDTRSGTLTGPLRQVSLVPIRLGGLMSQYSVSPDGRSVAFIEDADGMPIRLVPTTGGTVRTLAGPSAVRRNSVTWSPDGKAVSYVEWSPGPGDQTRWSVAIDGSSPRVVGRRSSGGMGVLSPDNRYAFGLDRDGRHSTIRVMTPEGQVVGRLPVWGGRYMPVAGGKYLVGQSVNDTAPIKLLPVSGGATRQLSGGNGYHWPDGWSADGSSLWISTGVGPDSINLRWIEVTPAGEKRREMSLPPGTTAVAQNDEYFVYATLPSSFPDTRIYRVSLRNGTRRELAGPVSLGCRPVAAGGMYYGSVGKEFYFSQKVGDRVQVRAMTIDGTSRLIADLASCANDEASVFHDRLAFLTRDPDSTRVRFTTGPRTEPRTLVSFGPAKDLGIAWSRDGRQLALFTDVLTIYQFDEAGSPLGAPRTYTLPFEYWWEAFWLADNSGFTMIAQPRGAPTTEIAVVKLGDPDHPTFLTKDDPNNISGHSLSPDGKWVAYPSESSKGSAFYLIEVEKLLKQMTPAK